MIGVLHRDEQKNEFKIFIKGLFIYNYMEVGDPR